MATNEFVWTMTELIARWRKITGLRETTDISDVELAKRINDYLVNYFPEQAGVDDLRTIYAATTSMTDDGTVALAQTDRRIVAPIMFGTVELEFFRDPEAFFRLFPEDEQYVSPPTLVIGSSDSKKVKNAEFHYDINGTTYTKASAETALSGDTIPQEKYGAFALTIETDGTITASEADNNSEGYLTAALAVDALRSARSDSAFMGYVTVIETASGGFVPGTTDLATGGTVTVTYTDGMWEKRRPPEACLIYQEKLWLRPKSDDIYRITAPRNVRGTALDSGDENALPDLKWGPAIALGDAILYLRTISKERTVSDELTDAFDFRIDSISSKARNNVMGGIQRRSF